MNFCSMKQLDVSKFRPQTCDDLIFLLQNVPGDTSTADPSSTATALVNASEAGTNMTSTGHLFMVRHVDTFYSTLFSGSVILQNSLQNPSFDEGMISNCTLNS